VVLCELLLIKFRHLCYNKYVHALLKCKSHKLKYYGITSSKTIFLQCDTYGKNVEANITYFFILTSLVLIFVFFCVYFCINLGCILR